MSKRKARPIILEAQDYKCLMCKQNFSKYVPHEIHHIDHDTKNNTLSNFATQNRLVTREDYIIRSYSMPAKFGSVSKAYIVPDDQILQQDQVEKRVPNPLAMNMYVLGYN